MSDQTKILICDDSILARKQMMDAISAVRNDIEFIQAVNGEEAVNLYREHEPALCFFDIVMPVKDGTTAVAEIIADYPAAEIIMVSSIGSMNLLKTAIEAGAKDFVQKPFDAAHIQDIVNRRLGGQ